MMNVVNSVITELKEHILERANDCVIDDTNVDDWHFHCFNEDYYVIYHSEAEKWLAKHVISAFEALDYIKEEHENHFGEFNIGDNAITPEWTVNQYVYFAGYAALPHADNIEDLREALED